MLLQWRDSGQVGRQGLGVRGGNRTVQGRDGRSQVDSRDCLFVVCLVPSAASTTSICNARSPHLSLLLSSSVVVGPLPMKPWTTPQESVWLMERNPQWQACRRRRKVANWLMTTTNDFVAAFPSWKSFKYDGLYSVSALSPCVLCDSAHSWYVEDQVVVLPPRQGQKSRDSPSPPYCPC